MRDNAFFQEFKEFSKSLFKLFILNYGTDRMIMDEASIKITIIKGEWAYVTYRGWIGGAELDLAKEGGSDIYRKVGGKWYDVTELPYDPGYNEEDLP